MFAGVRASVRLARRSIAIDPSPLEGEGLGEGVSSTAVCPENKSVTLLLRFFPYLFFPLFPDN